MWKHQYFINREMFRKFQVTPVFSICILNTRCQRRRKRDNFVSTEVDLQVDPDSYHVLNGNAICKEKWEKVRLISYWVIFNWFFVKVRTLLSIFNVNPSTSIPHSYVWNFDTPIICQFTNTVNLPKERIFYKSSPLEIYHTKATLLYGY